uniref:Uncharacterized protein n=1 Tax=Seriola dumerili TaxID=41447 RepID=A0A3B4TXD6_SERDU
MWKKVIWSDEERYRPECLTPAVRGSGGSVMLWEALFLAWFGSTANQYKVVRTDHLYPMTKHFYPDESGVTEWFDEYENNVNHMLWPSESPDLNPEKISVSKRGIISRKPPRHCGHTPPARATWVLHPY